MGCSELGKKTIINEHPVSFDFFLPGGDSAEPPHELEDDADPGENQTVHVVRPITIMTLLAYLPTKFTDFVLLSVFYSKTHSQYTFFFSLCLFIFFPNHSSFVIFSMSKCISLYVYLVLIIISKLGQSYIGPFCLDISYARARGEQRISGVKTYVQELRT